MILGQSWIKKHKVIIDMTNKSLIFWPDHYIYIRATFLLSPLSLPIEIVAIKIEEDITPQKMTKKGLKKNIPDFLQTPNKLSSKKKK